MFLKLYDHGNYCETVLTQFEFGLSSDDEVEFLCDNTILQKLIRAKIGEIFPIEFCDDKIFVIKLSGDHVIFRDAIFWVFGIE